MTTRLDAFLEVPLISRVRRNHGLEHATIHMLSKKIEKLSIMGRSDFGGFTLYGDVPTEQVQDSVEEALTRLRNGEHNLAIHPNCGTNFLTAGLMAGLAAFAAMLGGGGTPRSKLDRFPLVILATTAALIFTQPLGYAVQQRVTTSGEMRDLQVTGIERQAKGRLVTHRVSTTG